MNKNIVQTKKQKNYYVAIKFQNINLIWNLCTARSFFTFWVKALKDIEEEN